MSLDIFEKDALRFRYLQSIPALQAQAYFWLYGSKKQRAKAIDEDIKDMNRLIISKEKASPYHLE